MLGLTPVGTEGEVWAGEAGLRAAASAEGLTNVFNPSLSLGPRGTAVAFRALPAGGAKPFHAFLAVRSPDAEWSLTSLTAQAAEAEVAPTADPKLFRWADELYVTFNTGYSPVQNEIHLMRVSPTPGRPQKCVLRGDRQRVEKNWAFFAADDGGLRAVYQLAPYTELRLVEGTLGGEGDLVFEKMHAGTAVHADQLTIGTPVLQDGVRLLVVAHEKIRVWRKRAYLGRLVEIMRDGRGGGEVRVSPRRLVHSYRALLPSARPHNPNLISATYFSGLAVLDDALLVGYGINDKALALRRIEEDRLWS